MRLARYFAVVVLATLTACSMKVVRVDMDAARLGAAQTAPPRIVPLGCAYRLGGIVDARPNGSDAGGLGEYAFQFPDATGIVRQQLLAAGLQDTGDQAPVVDVRIMQLYLAQNLGTKTPVAVYQVAMPGHPPFLLRSQKPTANWNGTQNEAYAAYARVLADVNLQLIGRLNTHCAKD